MKVEEKDSPSTVSCDAGNPLSSFPNVMSDCAVLATTNFRERNVEHAVRLNKLGLQSYIHACTRTNFTVEPIIYIYLCAQWIQEYKISSHEISVFRILLPFDFGTGATKRKQIRVN